MNVCVPLLAALVLVAVASGSSDIEPLNSEAASAGSRLTRDEPVTDSKLTRDEPDTDSKLTTSPIREANQARAASEQSNTYKNSAFRSSGYENADKYKPNGYGNDKQETSGRHGNGGYGHDSVHGKSTIHRPTHFKTYIVHLPTTDGPTNELDQLFTRVEAVRDQVKTAGEESRALAARQAVQMMFLDRLVAIVLNELKNTDKSQDNALDRLEGFLAALDNEIDTEISNRVTEVKTRNQNNAVARQGLQSLLADLEDADVIQSGVIRDLFSTANDFRGRLDQISRNEFELFEDTVESAEARLKYARATDSRGMCESGGLTLDADERAVNYQYLTPFPGVPQVITGLCGFNFDMDVIKDPEHFIKALYAFQSGYGGAGYGYEPPAEPDTIGVRVNSFSTATGLQVEGFDLSLGDTKAVDVKVCFMACSVGPGTGPVVHEAR
ncbi:hypothetical protein V1264_021454 [Littorina saxatilis]|uniref:Secreted protein n=2 Tax=Littorina saxatilis TaxID=31220 RepID=A0AAN9FVP7_9CAEN